MSHRISFECPACNKRLRSAARFIGRICPCPSCRQEIMVQPQTPEEQPPMLVMDDGLPQEVAGASKRLR